jgi:hypothetical protein
MTNPLGKNNLLIVIIIVALSAIIPGLMITGFVGINLFSNYEIPTIIAALGGILAGAFITNSKIFTFKGMLLGFLYNIGVLWATILYTQMRTTIIKIEIVVPILLGGLPAIIVYLIFFRKKKTTTKID